MSRNDILTGDTWFGVPDFGKSGESWEASDKFGELCDPFDDIDMAGGDSTGYYIFNINCYYLYSLYLL